MSVMEITFLGTGSAYPTPTRGVTCIALRSETWCWLFDCGEGSQIQLMRSSLKPGKISKIFISHLHGDHCFGLPGLMCTVSQNSARTEPVELYGPVGLKKFLRVALELSRSELGFDYIVHEMETVDKQLPPGWQDWEVDHEAGDRCHPNEKPGRRISPDADGVWNLFEDSKVSVIGIWLKHRIPSFGFVVEEKPLPGKLDAQAAKDKGVPPGKLFGKLKAGETVTLEDGTEVRSDDVLGPPRPGRKVVILGDTSDASQLVSVGQGADVLIHEATLEGSLETSAVEKGHSTPAMAASICRDIGAKQLILTHFSQRYKPLSAEVKKGEDSVSVLLDEAEDIMGKNSVICAEDFTVYTVPVKS